MMDNDQATSDCCTLHEVMDIMTLIARGAYEMDSGRIFRAVWLTNEIRRKLETRILYKIVSSSLGSHTEACSRLLYFIPKENEHDMDVEDTTPELDFNLPEVEIYNYLLVLLFLIDKKRYDEAKACSTVGIARLEIMKLMSTDLLASRLCFYYSLVYELTDNLSEIRKNLHRLHQMAIFCHFRRSQETLLNLLLRNYLHYNLYDQAEKLSSTASRFEFHSNQQFCRYLFYVGKIKAIQLEYTDAKDSLMRASHQAPHVARCFKILCDKWAVLVRLLLGEIPERSIFMQKGMKYALVPYFELTHAVRIGDLELFQSVKEKFSAVFSKDRTNNLIVRLRHNVVRAGLRNISLSYCRINLVDVANKLRLNSDNPVADAESIAAKAIQDGTIDATLDHDKGWMVSKETSDVYSTNEPQIAFNSRIAFCLNMHNEAVWAGLIAFLRGSGKLTSHVEYLQRHYSRWEYLLTESHLKVLPNIP